MKLRIALAAGLAWLLAACASQPGKIPPVNPFDQKPESERLLNLQADALYRAARQALDASDFTTALARYNLIGQRFPFTDYATQAELETIYAKYRTYAPDDTITGADRFLKEHPRHPQVDYVYYLRGLTNMQRGDAFLDGLPFVDAAKHDVTDAQRAFDDFSLLVQRFPDSRYAADARARMIYLRDRVADHELHIARFYMKRGAYVACSKRAEEIVSDYPGAPATVEAMRLIEKSNRYMGLKDQADDAARILAANRDTVRFAERSAESPGLLARLGDGIGDFFSFFSPKQKPQPLPTATGASGAASGQGTD